jgi:3-oxoacyl-[acyl-carrier-protein] synthase III
LGSYSPGDPIPFDGTEGVLGPITKAPAKLLSWIDRVRPIFKEMLGISAYYYALDPKTRQPIDDNISMCAKAAEIALGRAGLKPAEIDLIIYAGIIMEYICPPTSVLIQERLGIPHCADFSIHSNCTSLYKAVQVGADFIANGRYRNALVLTSLLASPFLRAEYFHQEILEKKQVFLRWFLCDGAGAMVLTANRNQGRHRLRVIDTYIESAGLGLGPDMYCVMGGHRSVLKEAFDQGWHHLNQNFENVAKLAPKLAKQAVVNMIMKTGINLHEVKYFFANIPTKHLSDLLITTIQKDLKISHLNFYTKVSERGYAGPAAVVISLDEFFKEIQPERGDLLMSTVTESSKWMHGGFLLEYEGKVR